MAVAIPAHGGEEHSAAPARREFGRHAAWYVAAGAATTGLQALLFLALRQPLGSHPANLLAIAVTTLANTEFHRRVTFAGAASPTGRRYLQAVLTFAFYAGYGAAVLFTLHAVAPQAGAVAESVAVAAASLAGGVIRFLALRSWVFLRG
ncbi:GtrA family protein [Amycolatopsis cihanbeyliensis]|uniref:Putative flippase GtrA n=1 Tax=Amycolatopsis cihanbeyliensis TaxID=1128664 RepID=A0A542CUB9_AMYCI|nr:GtrA family protein [Amycolatopsis cihanbeyliensis]TQI94418.1 putative flippase GtrA [Amycolatopsis cihanbeyliensis]